MPSASRAITTLWQPERRYWKIGEPRGESAAAFLSGQPEAGSITVASAPRSTSNLTA